MLPLNQNALRKEMNRLGSQREAFLFFTDFKAEKGCCIPLTQLEHSQNIACCINGKTYGKPAGKPCQSPVKLSPKPIPFDQYQLAFDHIQAEIQAGNTYLLNLTCATDVGYKLPLEHIYHQTKAPYKIWVDDLFVCYSPESFVRIDNNTIRSFPMKGTRTCLSDDDTQALLNDPKERYEHNTIVDLIRNDLSMVATKVNVERFRYIERIECPNKCILQTVSEISGILPNNWHTFIGDLIIKLLPAGSISGAPKHQTVEIISNTENTEREFYTGVMGIFDGCNLNSGVMIRFIRQAEDGQCYYHSGGGITFMSDAKTEYQELLDKIYAPSI